MKSKAGRRGCTLKVFFWLDSIFIACLVLASNPAFAASCQPVRKYTYALAADVALSCSPRSVTVFDILIPDRGRFLVRANLRLRGTGTVPGLVHGWSAHWSGLGDPGFSRRIPYAAGEDLCAGETRNKGVLGFGKLTAANHGISLAIDVYRASDCQNGAVTAGAGSSLELWVEDAAPSCQGKDIAAFSYFDRQRAFYGDERDRPVAVDASPRSIVEGSIALTTPARSFEIIGQTEISPPSTENTCDRRDEYGGAWLYVNGASIAGGYQADTYPPSTGITHLLLTPSIAVAPPGPGLYRFGIAAAVRQSGNEPAVAGTQVSGDSVVAAVALRDPPPASAPQDGTAAPVARENNVIRGGARPTSTQQATAPAAPDPVAKRGRSQGRGSGAKPPS